MRFYTNQHKFYCGIDLHARSIYVCIWSQDGEILLHRNMKAVPQGRGPLSAGPGCGRRMYLHLVLARRPLGG